MNAQSKKCVDSVELGVSLGQLKSEESSKTVCGFERRPVAREGGGIQMNRNAHAPRQNHLG
jgi:hypothetical protein